MRADKREELADQISRIPDEELRANLQQSMSGLFLFLEVDLEQGLIDAGFQIKPAERCAP